MLGGIRLVNVRILNEKGSETIQVTQEEAEQKMSEALKTGFLVVNDDTKTQITELGETENILLIPPMAGG